MYDMNNIKQLPSPENLTKKVRTKVFSIRLKESTIAEFEKYAQMYDGATVNSLMSGVLDAYVAAQDIDTSNPDINKKIMRQYLEKLAVRVAKMDEEDLASKIVTDGAGYMNWGTHFYVDDSMSSYSRGIIEMLNNTRPVATLRIYLDEIEKLRSGEDVMSAYLLFSYELDSDYDTFTFSIMAYGNTDNDWEIMGSDESVPLRLNVAVDKFLYVINLMIGYIKKSISLYGSKRRIIDMRTARAIIDVLNKSDRPEEFTKQIAWLLASYNDEMEEDGKADSAN